MIALRISTKLIPAKASYFFASGSKYSLLAFLVLFLTDNGLDVQKAGIITAVRYIVEVVGATGLNILTDRFKTKASIILTIFIFLESSVIFLMPWLPGFVKDLDCLYKMFLLCNAVVAFFEGGIIPTIDAQVMTVTKEVSEHGYVSQRVWNSIGLGVLPFVAGLVLHKTKHSRFGNHALFLIVVASNLMLLISCFFLFKNEKKAAKDHEIKERKIRVIDWKKKDELISWHQQFRSIGKALKNGQNWITLFSYLSIGIGFVFQYTFVFLLLQNELHASNTVMGLGALSQAIAEALGSHIGVILAKYFCHEFFPIAIALYGFAACFFAYYFVKHIIVMFLVNILMGLSYATFIYPAANMIFKNTDKLSRGVIYAIALTLLNGVGGCFAGVLGGYLFKTYGGRKTFFSGAGMFVILGVLFTCVYLYTRTFMKKNEVEKVEAKEPILVSDVKTDV